MRCFSIDIETTGLNPNKHGITEFAAVMFDLFDAAAGYKCFYRYVNPEDLVWSQFCLNMHAKWLADVNERIRIKYCDGPPKICQNMAEVQLEFQQWLFVECGFEPPDEKGRWKDKITPAGKNFASFDRAFLLANGFPPRMFHHRSVDPGPLYIRKGDAVPPEFKLCKERAIEEGCEFESDEVAHNAMDDAFDVIKLLHHRFTGPISDRTSSYDD